MKINKTIHEIPSVNYWQTITPKTQIVISTTLRANGNHIIRLKHKDFGKSKKWPMFTITRGGKVYQHFDPKYQSDFLGIKVADCKLISISLENMGFLVKRNTTGEFVNWLNEVCDSGDVVEKKYLGYDYWEDFTDNQMNSLANLCIYLCDEFGIPKECIDFNHYHKDIHKFKGIVLKSNYIENTNDTNPMFNIEKFNDLLNKE